MRPGLDPAAFGPNELEHIAKDVGVAPAELLTLARWPDDAADLLLRRMAALGLDCNEVRRAAPHTYKDMQRVCTLCDRRRRCARDLAHNPDDPAWTAYCPNVGTLKALDAMPQVSRSVS